MRNRDEEYKKKYETALRIIQIGELWSLVLSTFAAVWGGILAFNGINGGWWILGAMVVLMIISTRLIYRASKRQWEERKGLLDGGDN